MFISPPPVPMLKPNCQGDNTWRQGLLEVKRPGKINVLIKKLGKLLTFSEKDTEKALRGGKKKGLHGARNPNDQIPESAALMDCLTPAYRKQFSKPFMSHLSMVLCNSSPSGLRQYPACLWVNALWALEQWMLLRPSTKLTLNSTQSCLEMTMWDSWLGDQVIQNPTVSPVNLEMGWAVLNITVHEASEMSWDCPSRSHIKTIHWFISVRIISQETA